MKDVSVSEQTFTKALIIKYRLFLANDNGYKTAQEQMDFATAVLCLSNNAGYRLLAKFPKLDHISFNECKKKLIQQSDQAFKIANII